VRYAMKLALCINKMLSALKYCTPAITSTMARHASKGKMSAITNYFQKRKEKKEDKKFQEDFQLYLKAGASYNMLDFEEKIKKIIQVNSGFKAQFAKNKGEIEKYKYMGSLLTRKVFEGVLSYRKETPALGYIKVSDSAGQGNYAIP
jgi:hypothetical protein